MDIKCIYLGNAIYSAMLNSCSQKTIFHLQELISGTMALLRIKQVGMQLIKSETA